MNAGFSPNIRCPYCGKSSPVEISGFGRLGYNSREKDCKFCNESFVVEAFVTVAKKGKTVSDIFYSGPLETIRRIRKERKKIFEELLKMEAMVREIHREEQKELYELATQTGGTV